MSDEHQESTDAPETGTLGRLESIAVEKIGRQLLNSGLGADDSLLTPGFAIWTIEHLDELTNDYV